MLSCLSPGKARTVLSEYNGGPARAHGQRHPLLSFLPLFSIFFLQFLPGTLDAVWLRRFSHLSTTSPDPLLSPSLSTYRLGCTHPTSCVIARPIFVGYSPHSEEVDPRCCEQGRRCPQGNIPLHTTCRAYSFLVSFCSEEEGSSTTLSLTTVYPLFPQ